MMQPEEFVKVLAVDMGASAVVAGSNYRFGEVLCSLLQSFSLSLILFFTLPCRSSPLSVMTHA